MNTLQGRKTLLNLFIIVFSFSACKTTSYQFVSPALNTTVHKTKGSGHAGLIAGTIGIGIKGGWALSDRISINGYLGGIPEAKDSYTSREAELSLGIQRSIQNNRVTKFFVGLGYGHNELDMTALSGNYARPFIQLQHTSFDRKILNGKLYLDATAGGRLNLLVYRGENRNSNFDQNVLYTEPFVAFSIGTRALRLDIMQGVAIKTSGRWEKGIRIHPYLGNVGVLMKF